MLMGLSLYGFSQNQHSMGDFWNNVYYGGGIGLGFGNNTFNVSLAPSAIYQINEQFATGVGLNFIYSKFRDSKLIAYGGSILTLFNPISPIQLSGEFEQLRVHRDFNSVTVTLRDNYWSPALFFGVGYSSRYVTIGIRYDVLYDEGKSIYADPWMPFIRVYF